MNSKTLDTALLSLSVGCLVIGIYEVMTRGWEIAYFWVMISVALLLWFRIRKYKSRASSQQENVKKTGGRPFAAKPPAVSKSKRKRK